MSRWDAIVVGARCAGSPVAMLLARKGYKVLVVDRASFPSDTISTHVVHPHGVALLAKWGLLDRLVATGCPPIHTYVFDFGPIAIEGSPGTESSPIAYCPRRIVLDKLLVDAAREAGAEVREDFIVDDIVIDDGIVTGIRGHAKNGATVTESAKIVIGADGKNSIVARAVNARTYNEKPDLLCPYYAYWSGLPMNGRFETYARGDRGCALVETHDGLTCVMGGWPVAQFEENKADFEANYMAIFDRIPAVAERLRGARRETKIFGMITPNFFRVPFGPGWALAGDAGYTKDPITAQGIVDAFHDAELLATALDDTWTRRRTFDDAGATYQTTRDARIPMYEMTAQIASMAPPPPEMQQLLGAIHGNRDLMDAFCRMNAGTESPDDFGMRCQRAMSPA